MFPQFVQSLEQCPKCASYYWQYLVCPRDVPECKDVRPHAHYRCVQCRHEWINQGIFVEKRRI